MFVRKALSVVLVSVFSLLPVFAFVGIPEVAHAANSFYVSPTGSSSGNGSMTAPWDLQTALYCGIMKVLLYNL